MTSPYPSPSAGGSRASSRPATPGSSSKNGPALYREKHHELITDACHIATALAARGDLRDNLTVTEAADHLNAITGPELHRVLVIDRGWTPERYRAWTRRNLENYLLEPPS
jgi:hypothetical protein